MNYSVKYRPNTDYVLKNLSFMINPGEKIGIIGRTGSGKSTLCLSLFRILEASKGGIYIDDVNISDIGLKKLRSNLTLIPQDPVLMEGSLRFNIDPLRQYSDSEIINIIKAIEFNLYFDNSEGLEYKVFYLTRFLLEVKICHLEKDN